MAGLVSYGSSDEEDNSQDGVPEGPLDANKPTPSDSGRTNGLKSSIQPNGDKTSATQPLLQPEPDAPLVGPALGPRTMDLSSELLENDPTMTPQSPYSANRALSRDLTLPAVPNYDIPPSPPGSPMEGSNAKFKQFLELKRKGIHFNEKLAKSSALKNPSLMQKLMDFADVDEIDQCATTLPKDLWNPDGFPEHAYKEELAKSQQRILKRKEDEKVRGHRESVDFVPASTAGESLSRNGTPSNGRPGQKSAAERIMAGLDRGRSSSPQVTGAKRENEI